MLDKTCKMIVKYIMTAEVLSVSTQIPLEAKRHGKVHNHELHSEVIFFPGTLGFLPTAKHEITARSLRGTKTRKMTSFGISFKK